MKSQKIIRGSCWDYINAIYKKSGVKKRVYIFKSKKRGPYAPKELFRPGDWVYHINHSYHNIEHSGLFIGWIDKRRYKALMLSYAGENRRVPARFKVYNIDSSYTIIRAKGAIVREDYIPLKDYAIKNKISIFEAMKLVKSNRVEYITKEVNGKEKIFIKDSLVKDNSYKKMDAPLSLEELNREIKSLKKRVKELEDRIGKGEW